MNRKQIITDLVRERELLSEQITLCQARLSVAPPGKIKTVNRSTYSEYYIRKDVKDKTGQYIKKNDISTLQVFSQKEYDTIFIKQASQRIKDIDTFLFHYNEDELINLQEHFTQTQQKLINSFEIDNNSYLRNWINQQYSPKYLQSVTTVHYSEKGEQMRSKSEVIIADTLSLLDIPYHYEKPLKLNNGIILHPDFTLPDVFARRDIYYEHLGLIDNADYFIKNMKRFDMFADNNIVVGQNLIVTYETANKPLTRLQVIETLRKYYISRNPLPYNIIIP